MTPRLLDADVLVALVDEAHAHHRAVSSWLPSGTPMILCPVTEGALVRYLLRRGESTASTEAVLHAIHALPTVGFVADTASYARVPLTALRDHRQATETYLVTLARDHGSVLATLDRGLAARWPDSTELVPG